MPYTRGEEFSRPFDDVLTEIAGLAAQGVKEVMLLGQNVNVYRGPMGGSGETADFALLIEYVAEIPGIERIRYTTSHPNEFTQRLIDVYGKVPKLANQSFCDFVNHIIFTPLSLILYYPQLKIIYLL